MNFAIIGTGGFAGTHHKALISLEEKGLAKLLATCDIGLRKNEAIQEKFAFGKRGVSLYDDYREMLDGEGGKVDIVIIPTPIQLHAEMHREVVQRGLAVYLEKPPTLLHSELDEMLKVEETAKSLTNVGFNFIIDPVRQTLKQRMLAGEFGKVLEVHFLGLWPRDDRYFNRCPWAGKLFLDNQPVIDSCMGNAMGHFLHNSLFWAGPTDLFSWAYPDQVKAEAYRAHQIESADTFFTEITPAEGPVVRLAMTHAYDGRTIQKELVETEKAFLHYDAYGPCWLEWKGHSQEVEPLETERTMFVPENLLDYGRYVKGEKERPQTRLADTVPFVQTYNLTFLASRGITSVPNSLVRETKTEDAKGLSRTRHILGIEETCKTFLNEGLFPSAQNVPWSRPGETATPEDLPKFLPFLRELDS
ncbi:MAG: Gfo/Idh/MocA family oxidoreductase [Opitutales bacterium]|nr:Gfo/Idh/MocA family oxidoreductase [Opitutales bacterium]